MGRAEWEGGPKGQRRRGGKLGQKEIGIEWAAARLYFFPEKTEKNREGKDREKREEKKIFSQINFI